MTHHTEIFHTRHCTYNLHVHLVFVVKYRKKIFTAEILKDLKIIFETICLELDADLIEFDGEQDHVHLLILYPPKLAISDLVFRLKGVSSRLIRQRNYILCYPCIYRLYFSTSRQVPGKHTFCSVPHVTQPLLLALRKRPSSRCIRSVPDT